MYFGEALTRLDEKGRITIPAQFRKPMSEKGHLLWYLSRGFDHCIFMFCRDEWEKIVDHARQYPAMDADSLDYRRLLFSSVSEAGLDRQGRVAVAPHLREHAGLEKDAVLIGVNDHLELWDKEAWRSFRQSNETGFKEMASQLSRARASLG